MDLDPETEWDIQSIKRYEKLLMFEAEYPVRQMELLGGEGRLCCLGDRICRRSGDPTSLLTVYSVPPRLGSDKNGASLSPHFDLKIIAGTLNKNYLTQIACVGKSDCIVASESRAEELLMYRLNTNESDKLVMSGVLSCEGLTNPRISASSDTVVACKHSDSRISIIDIKSRNEVGKRHWSGEEAVLAPVHLGPTLVMVYSTDDATAVLYDTRQPHPAASIKGGNGERAGWTAASSYDETTRTEARNLAFLSKSGSTRIYSLNQPNSPRTQLDLGSRLQLKSNSPCSPENGANDLEEIGPTIKVNPLNNDIIAAGGLDSRIYIIDTEPSCSIAFVHDGHEHMESCLGLDTRTSYHIFYPSGGDKALISSAANSSINCWSYNPI